MDILIHIFAHLDNLSLIRASQVCRSWRHSAQYLLHQITNLDQTFKLASTSAVCYNYYLHYYGNYLTLEEQLALACRLSLYRLVAALLDKLHYPQVWASWLRRPSKKLTCSWAAGASGSIILYKYLSSRSQVDYSEYFKGACQYGHSTLAHKLLPLVPNYNRGIILTLVHGWSELCISLIEVIKTKHTRCAHYIHLISIIFQTTCAHSCTKMRIYFSQNSFEWFSKLDNRQQNSCIQTLLTSPHFDDEWLTLFYQLLPLINNLNPVILAAARGGHLALVCNLTPSSPIDGSELLNMALISGDVKLVQYIYSQLSNPMILNGNSLWRITPAIYEYLCSQGQDKSILAPECCKYLLRHLTPQDLPLISSLLRQESAQAPIFLRLLLLQPYRPLEIIKILLSYVSEAHIVYALEIVITRYVHPYHEPLFELLWQNLPSYSHLMLVSKIILYHGHIPLLRKLPLNLCSREQITYLLQSSSDTYAGTILRQLVDHQ
jgi:hypothetical protein